MALRTLVVTAALLVVTNSATAMAQSCGQFRYGDCAGVHNHEFIQNLFTHGKNSPLNFHSECDNCEIFDDDPPPGEWVIVHPSECHHQCEVFLAQNQQAAYDHLLVAALEGDLQAALLAGKGVPGRVAVHRERRALQIEDCNGRIIASLPLGEFFDVAVATFEAPDNFQASSAEGMMRSPVGLLFVAGLLAVPFGRRLLRRRDE